MSRRTNTFIRQLGNNVTPVSLGYGRLYNGWATSDAKFSPTNWSVPSKSNYETLLTYLSTNAASKLGGNYDYWNDGDLRNNADFNLSGFNAYPGGRRNETLPCDFETMGVNALFYTTDIFMSSYYYVLVLISGSSTTYNPLASVVYRNVGISVRLIYTGVGTPSSTLTDYDGNIYDVIQIGTQYWTVQNWKCIHLNDGTSIPEVTVASTWASLISGAWCFYDNDSSYL